MLTCIKIQTQYVPIKCKTKFKVLPSMNNESNTLLEKLVSGSCFQSRLVDLLVFKRCLNSFVDDRNA